MPGGPGVGPGPGGIGAAKPRDTINLQAGETIRYRMATGKTIERVHVVIDADKFVDVTPDPTDASRILIKGLVAGSVQVELTDTDGTKEKLTVRVK